MEIIKLVTELRINRLEVKEVEDNRMIEFLTSYIVYDVTSQDEEFVIYVYAVDLAEAFIHLFSVDFDVFIQSR